MNTSIYKLLSQSLGFAEKQIEKTIDWLDSGATIPFISRYRKEATGSLDEVQIGNIKEAYNKLCETEKRKKFIISTIEEQGKLSEELKQRIDSDERNSGSAVEQFDCFFDLFLGKTQ